MWGPDWSTSCAVLGCRPGSHGCVPWSDLNSWTGNHLIGVGLLLVLSDLTSCLAVARRAALHVLDMLFCSCRPWCSVALSDTAAGVDGSARATASTHSCACRVSRCHATYPHLLACHSSLLGALAASQVHQTQLAAGGALGALPRAAHLQGGEFVGDSGKLTSANTHVFLWGLRACCYRHSTAWPS